MARGSKSKRLFSSQNIAGSATANIDIPEHKYVSIQVAISEACLCAASVVCEDISLSANSYTEPCHGFATGLKGTLAAVIGCALATPAACFDTCCNVITEACHSFTTGERGRFTSDCTLPSFCCCAICACTDYYVISLTCCTYNVATSRANALAGTGVCITGAGVGNHTFTPNGAIPTGSTACSFIIKIDCDTFKLATSKANAEAGTVDAITALNSPASITFTPACADCTSGVVTIKYSNCTTECATYLVDTDVKLLACTGIITACGLNVLDAHTVGAVPYKSIQVDVDVTDSQWVTTIDIHAKE